MLRLAGGRLVDPRNQIDSVADLWVEDGRIVAPPQDGKADETIDLSGCVVMAGGIDIHTHVAGGNVSTARLLLPERYAHEERGGPWQGAPPDTYSTGALYAQMGFTLVVEPAMAPVDAISTHIELETIPYVDRAALAVLGNDDVLLGMMRERASDAAVADYVGWSLATSRAIGVKSINPGAVAAFKDDVRTFDLDDVVPEYGVTPREISARLRTAVKTLGVPHPLHLHTCNLGRPGNIETAVATIDAAEGERLHIAHAQFYGYGAEGSFGFSSGAARLAEAIVRNPNVTADIGQVMFGPTVTISSDVLTQFNARGHAKPKKWSVSDGDSNGGGIVPFTYRRRSKVNALQWAIGLELFLLIDDPWRVFLTTDHPNGGPFTSYPEIIALLMDKDRRAAALATLPKEALETSTLAGLTREYTLTEIAVMTRAAPAALLGVQDRGHLGAGAVADIAAYRDGADRQAMFARAELVLKEGHPIVRGGTLLAPRSGRTLTLSPDYDPAIKARVADSYERRWGAPSDAFAVPNELLSAASPFEVVPCRP
jgi:formylmethanofuran dehydrogenase subunit A